MNPSARFLSGHVYAKALLDDRFRRSLSNRRTVSVTDSEAPSYSVDATEFISAVRDSARQAFSNDKEGRRTRYGNPYLDLLADDILSER
jgi:hypothetical protein